MASFRLSTVRISSDSIRPTGMPVQLSTISAIAWPSTTGKISGCSPCSVRSLPSVRASLSALGLAASSACRRRAASAAAFVGRTRRPRSRPRTRVDLGHQLPLGLPALLELCQLRRLVLCARYPARRAVPRGRAPAAVSRSTISSSVSISAMRRRRSSIGAGIAVWLIADAGAGGVEQADRLVGQLAGRDVARRQAHRLAHRLVEDAHLVVLLQRRRPGRASSRSRPLLARLLDLHHLEAAGQRRVLLEVLLVLGPGRGRDGAQLAAGQGRLEQVGRVALPGLAAGADQRVRLVDEQDDRRGRLP